METISSSQFAKDLRKKMAEGQFFTISVMVKCTECGRTNEQLIADIHPIGGMPERRCPSCGTVWFAEIKPKF